MRRAAMTSRRPPSIRASIAWNAGRGFRDDAETRLSKRVPTTVQPSSHHRQDVSALTVDPQLVAGAVLRLPEVDRASHVTGGATQPPPCALSTVPRGVAAVGEQVRTVSRPEQRPCG